MPPARHKRAKVPRLAADVSRQGTARLAPVPGFVPQRGGGA